MSILRDRNIGIIAMACVFTYAVYLIVEYIITGGQLGAPLDDTWIHFRFAENFANGHFFEYNIGEPTSGTTSPLWLILLAGVSFISSNYLFNSVFLSAVFHFFSCILIYLLAVNILSEKKFNFSNPRFYALVIGLMTVITGRFAWAGLSGMETTMFAFFSIAGIYVHIKNLGENKFNFLPTLFFALATLSRPEGFLLFSLYIFDAGINFFHEKRLKRNVIKIVLSVLFFSALTLPYLLFSYKTSGHFFPNTFRGQGGGFSFLPNIKYLQVTATFLLRDNFLAAIVYFGSLIFYISGIRKYFGEFRKVNLIYLWVFMLPIVSSVLIPNWRHHGRYMIPALPFINFAVIFTLLMFREKLKEGKLKDYLYKPKYIAVLASVSLIYYGAFAVHLGNNTDNINDQQVYLANWTKNNIPPGDVIALNDIGAITFIAKNRIIDMAGLVTPEILRYRTYQWHDNLDSTYLLLKNNNVKYLIIYDHWFDEFLNKYGSHFEFVNSAILQNNTICGGDTMKVYKANLY